MSGDVHVRICERLGVRLPRATRHAFTIAETYAYRGQSDQALQWLERAKLQKDAGLYFTNASILFKKLAPDPRYRAFLRKMNLPE